MFYYSTVWHDVHRYVTKLDDSRFSSLAMLWVESLHVYIQWLMLVLYATGRIVLGASAASLAVLPCAVCLRVDADQ